MQWFEKEDFWLNYGPIMFDQQRWAESSAVAERVLQITGFDSGSSGKDLDATSGSNADLDLSGTPKHPKILDAGCGPGRISVELTSSSSGVEASIKVASEQIRQLVQDQLTQLRMNLSEQGVQVAEFTVDVQQDNQQGNGSQNENQQDFSIEALYQLLVGRKTDPKEGSYTTYLFQKGIDKILKKVGEECTEVIVAGKGGDREETIFEISDLMYHVMVLMVEMGIAPKDVFAQLASRHVVDHKVKQERMQ